MLLENHRFYSGFFDDEVLFPLLQLLLTLEQTALLALEHIDLAVELPFPAQQLGFQIAEGPLGALQLLLQGLALTAPLVLGFQDGGPFQCFCLSLGFIDDLLCGRLGIVEFSLADFAAGQPAEEKTEHENGTSKDHFAHHRGHTVSPSVI